MAKKTKKECSPEERLAAARVPKEEWPYELPEGWEWVTGHAIFESMESQKPEGEIFRYIDIDSIDNRNQRVVEPKVLRVDEAPSRARRKVHSGDTVFSMVRPYLKNIAYIDETLNDCIASTGFFVCKPSGFVNSKFLYWMMVSPYVVDGLNRYMKGDNSPSIRKDDVENYKYPLPPLKTQQRIVDHIESLFAKLDQAKEKAQHALATSETRKAAILHQAFTGQLTKKWREEHGVSIESWKNVTTKEICKDIKVGIVIKPSQYYTDPAEGIPAFRSANVRESHIEDDNWVYLNKEGQENNQRCIVRTGDVLIVRSGNPGVACVVTEEYDGYGAIDILIAVPNQQIVMSDYLCLYTNSPLAKEQIAQGKRGMALAHFNVGGYSKINMNLPPLLEQQEIVHILDTLMANEQRIQQAVETILQQIDDTKKSILAKAFRGEWEDVS